jgi:hypothetical protein
VETPTLTLDNLSREIDYPDEVDDGPALDPAAPREVTILADRLGEARKLLDKLCRKAVRFGNPDIRYTVGPVFSTQETRRRFDGRLQTVRGPDRVTLTIEGAAPQVGPFEFLAKVEHDPAGNVLDIVPGRTVDRRFRSTPSSCEHCQTKRARKDTFVLRNRETGAEVQVGRSCLKDYLGYESPAGLTAKFAFFRELRELDEDSWGGSGHWGSMCPVDESVALTIAAIRLWSWCSKGMAQVDERLKPTAQYVSTVLNPPPWIYKKGHEDDLADMKMLAAQVRPDDWDTAQTILAWVASGAAGSGDYGYNLLTVCARGVVEERRLGLVCSAVQAHDRAMEREVRLTADRATALKSSWVGAEKTRLKNVPVTQTDARVVGGNDWGETVLVKFVDDDGNIYSWFTGAGTGLHNGDRAMLTGTVKRHTEYKGVKETQLSRCVVTRIEK